MKATVFYSTLFAVSLAVKVVAVPFSFSFTASNLGGPVPTISGSFSGSYTPIDGFGTNAATLDSIDLKIAGFEYTTTNTILEVQSGLVNPIPISGGYRFFSIYGIAIGTGASGFTNDVRLAFTIMDNGAISPWMFYYATPTSPLFFDEDANIGTYRIVANAPSVPENGSPLGLLAAALAVVSVAFRMRALPKQIEG